MLLLTSRSETETDWRKCRPVDGSLFVVGDPKQSIYRFRRADIATYNQVRRIIERSGGLIVPLSANFRTIGPLVDWINGTFDQVFPAEATVHAPARRPLQTGRTEGTGGDLAGLRVLQVPGQYGTKDAVAEYETDWVARTIEAAIAKEQTIPRSRKDLERGIAPAAMPGDCLVPNLRHCGSEGHFLGRWAPGRDLRRTWHGMGDGHPLAAGPRHAFELGIDVIESAGDKITLKGNLKRVYGQLKRASRILQEYGVGPLDLAPLVCRSLKISDRDTFLTLMREIDSGSREPRP